MGIDISGKLGSKVDKEITPAISKIGSLLNRDIHFFSEKLNDKKKEAFYSGLGMLLSSGIDMRTSLEIVISQQVKTKDKQLFETINKDVISGDSLSGALLSSGKFTPYEYYSLKIGEETGRIKEVLNELTRFYNYKIKQKRQLTGAFTYPAMVLITAFAAVAFMMNFIVPMFVEVFGRFNGKLPALTVFIMKISEWFKSYFFLFLLCIVAIVLLVYVARKKKWFASASSNLMLKMPLIGDILTKIYISRFCQAMALLLGSKIPMLRALHLTSEMIGFLPFREALVNIESEVMHGIPLHESMKKHSFFDNRITSLTKVGEEVNQLDSIFERLNNQYSEELEHKIGMVGSLLEPILIILVGLLVAVVLISMYLPLFQLSTSIY